MSSTFIFLQWYTNLMIKLTRIKTVSSCTKNCLVNFMFVTISIYNPNQSISAKIHCWSGRWTSLFSRICFKAEIAKELLKEGVDINAKDCDGETVLHSAVRNGHLVTLKELLQHGANINLNSSFDGNSPFHIAIEKGYVNIVRLILDFGINLGLNFKNESEKTALELAFHEGQLDIVKMITTSNL